jgi:hypothetical protein
MIYNEPVPYLLFGICGFIILVILVVWIKLYIKTLAKPEAFTAAVADNNSNISQPWALDLDAGFKPLVIPGIRAMPKYKLGVSHLGSISNLIGQYIRRKILPLTLEVKPSATIILASLSIENTTLGQTELIDGLDLGFIREPQLIGLSRTENGIQSISVLAPAYWETIYLIGNKFTTFASLAELKRTATQLGQQTLQAIATQKIGVLRDSLPYWEAITRAHAMEIGRDFLKAENDNLAELLAQLERRELDAVFLIAHTFDARLQAFLKTNETRMISIFPLSKFPLDTDIIERPYNPETTNLISKFKEDMKIYIPWIFEETISMGRGVGNKRQLSVSNLGAGTSGSSIYKTFKIRSYLCCSRQLGRDHEFISGLGSRYLEEYQTMALLIQEWNKSGGKSTTTGTELISKQLVLPTLIFSDYDSFNPDTLGAIPSEIEINKFMRDLIATIYGRIKIEKIEPSCDI